MAQKSDNHTYKQGHNRYSTSSHERRRAETDAGFLLPHIKATDHILDVGCGPGTITTGFAELATKGLVVGVDISDQVLQKAQALANEANVPKDGPGSVTFQYGNVLERLPFNDDTFDVVFASQVLGHIPLPELPVKALSEMRRVLKPNGILGTRDASEQHAYPRSLEMDRLWFKRQTKVLSGSEAGADTVATLMPAFYRKAGFDVDAGKVRVGGTSSVTFRKEDREWTAKRMGGMLREGSDLYHNWLKAGMTENDIREAVHAVEAWAQTEDAWYVAMQCEMLAWK